MNDSKTLVVRDRREPVSVEERVQLLSQWEASGLGAREFSEQVGLRAHQLYGWRKMARRACAPAEWIEVPRPAEVRGWAAEVTTGDVVVRLSSVAAPVWAAQLVRELGRC